MAFREVYWKDTRQPEYKQVVKPDGKIGYERATVEHIESASMGSTIDWDKVERANRRSRKAVKK